MRRVLVALAVVAVAWAAAVAVLVVLGARAADQGYDELRAEADRIGLGELVSSDASLLDGPARTFDRADGLLSNPLVAPAELLPVLGRQIRSAATLADTADDLLDRGRRAMDVVQEHLDADLSRGPGPSTRSWARCTTSGPRPTSGSCACGTTSPRPGRWCAPSATSSPGPRRTW